MDLPYHANIGDTLIWEGEIQFIKQYLQKYKLLYACSQWTCTYPNIGNDTIILLHGGGNFGDVWRSSQQFKLEIISKYPDNKIIIFPQTVWYDNKETLEEDAFSFSRHKHLTICARDKKSYEILKKYFYTNSILLVPDMAFCIPDGDLKSFLVKRKNKTLFLRRTDKELSIIINYSDYISEREIDIHDWPSMERCRASYFLLRCFLWAGRKIPVIFPKLADMYASIFFKSAMIKTGVRFLSNYDKIYTTRLHGAILCCLLESPCILFDNSYGKNSNFFETWLSDVKGIQFINIFELK
jgi:pyruvyl transferase EpsO